LDVACPVPFVIAQRAGIAENLGPSAYS
jgi:hypothetical protein